MKYEHLTIERVRELLDYAPETGALTWRIRPAFNSRKRAGDIAGTVQSTGFRVIYLDGKLCQATQIAFLLANGRWANAQVGLKSSNTVDLSASNLCELRTTSKKHDLSTQEGKRAYSRDYWYTNAAHRHEVGIKRYFRMTAQQYAKMLHDQGGVCAICGLPERTRMAKSNNLKALSVDHNHGEADSVRGLLCLPCNSGLGYFKDNPHLLDKAAVYLRDRGWHQEDKVA